MNCFALEQRGQILLVDCGVTFDDRGIGVDVIHPSFAALEQYEAEGARIAGVVVTHGHEDHIGALPYLLRRFDCPVWAPPYALGLIKERLGEHEILQYARLNECRVRAPFSVGSFLVEPIRVTHSIADATALAIRTDAGLVIHSGDFKIDPRPSDGESFDAERLQELGDEGVALLLSDSTNVDSLGSTGSEEIVTKRSKKLYKRRPARWWSASSRRTCIGCACSAKSPRKQGENWCSSGAVSRRTAAWRTRRGTSFGRPAWCTRPSARANCRQRASSASRPGRRRKNAPRSRACRKATTTR
jgi:hypothetical protein